MLQQQEQGAVSGTAAGGTASAMTEAFAALAVACHLDSVVELVTTADSAPGQAVSHLPQTVVRGCHRVRHAQKASQASGDQSVASPPSSDSFVARSLVLPPSFTSCNSCQPQQHRPAAAATPDPKAARVLAPAQASALG